MTYFILLPLGLIVVLAGDFLFQRSVFHFVDTARLTRLGLLAVIVWTSAGWLLELSYASRVADIAAFCQANLTTELEDLETFVYEVVGGGP